MKVTTELCAKYAHTKYQRTETVHLFISVQLSFFKAIVNLFSSGKRILISYENNHYITHARKTASFQIYIFMSAKAFQFLFHFIGRKRLLLFNGLLFAQNISEEINSTCMDYDVF